MNETYDKVFGSPINNSHSKQLYSFGRSRRFRLDRPPDCEKFYTVKGGFTERATSFGLGNKTVLGVNNHVPPPGRYSIRSQFEEDMDKKRGFSFGSEQKKGIIDEKEAKVKPGPGAYTYRNAPFVNISYSMGCRTADSESKHRNKLGPGQYNTIGMSETGRYFYSKFPGSKCSKIGRSQRFSITKEEVPGPGTYRENNKLDINKEGVYFPSKYRSSAVRSFSRSQRRPLAQDDGTPGPGSQQPLSLPKHSVFRVRKTKQVRTEYVRTNDNRNYHNSFSTTLIFLKCAIQLSVQPTLFRISSVCSPFSGGADGAIMLSSLDLIGDRISLQFLSFFDTSWTIFKCLICSSSNTPWRLLIGPDGTLSRASFSRSSLLFHFIVSVSISLFTASRFSTLFLLELYSFGESIARALQRISYCLSVPPATVIQPSRHLNTPYGTIFGWLLPILRGLACPFKQLEAWLIRLETDASIRLVCT